MSTQPYVRPRDKFERYFGTFRPENVAAVSIRDIQTIIAYDRSISIKKMCSLAMDEKIVIARAGAMWLARLIDYSLAEIGRAFGDLDELTVQEYLDWVEECRNYPGSWFPEWLESYELVVVNRYPPEFLTRIRRSVLPRSDHAFIGILPSGAPGRKLTPRYGQRYHVHERRHSHHRCQVVS